MTLAEHLREIGVLVGWAESADTELGLAILAGIRCQLGAIAKDCGGKVLVQAERSDKG